MATLMQTPGIDKLTRTERIPLVDKICESITEEPKSSLTQAKRRELARRFAEHEPSPEDVVPWETVEAQALDRLASR